MEGSKRFNSKEKEDHISALPDTIIHHILSFLPTTKMAIQTGVLSKRWHNQWTRVPVLMFDSTGMSHGKFARSIGNTLILYECLKIQKFHIRSEGYNVEEDPHFDEKIRFASRRDVKELILEFHDCKEEFQLPKFLFNHASLVKLQTYNCTFLSNGRVNWGSLKRLDIGSCWLTDQKIENILSGSPFLESLELNDCIGLDNLVIASESLKVLFLVNLEISGAEISCPKLVELALDQASMSDENIKHVLSGSPSLESMVLDDCDGLEKLVIASQSLKILVLDNLETSSIEISCPNLVELSLDQTSTSDETIENVLTGSSLLESLELRYCDGFYQLVIASNSLKRLVIDSCEEFDQLVIASSSLEKLVLERLEVSSVIEISCPDLEKLKVLYSLYVKTFKLTNLTSIIRATLDFQSQSEESAENLAKQILEQLQHVEELKIRSQFIKILSALEEGGLSPPSLNNKCLILDGANFEEHPAGIAFALRSSPELEKLVIKMSIHEIYLHNKATNHLPELNNIEDNYWMMNETVFHCLVSHLKTVDIINLSKRDSTCMHLINFLGFLLKNARVLEKMVVIIDGETDFLTKVSEKLFSFPKCSEHADIKLLCYS